MDNKPSLSRGCFAATAVVSDLLVFYSKHYGEIIMIYIDAAVLQGRREIPY